MTALKLENENNYFVNNGKHFMPDFYFTTSQIEDIFNFAYAMTFGDEGEHRDHRTGGNHKRKKGEIFINTFQGKLSEFAVYTSFLATNQEAWSRLSPMDFDVYGLGEWDDTDIILENLKFSVKSTSDRGNLLLLERKDWNEKGEYKPNILCGKNALYHYFVLVRIKPDGKKVMKRNKLFYENSIDRDRLWNIINSERWEYDIAGYISHDDLIQLIKNDFILPQGSTLNVTTKMDAENYYIQSGDMKDFRKLILSL